MSNRRQNRELKPAIYDSWRGPMGELGGVALEELQALHPVLGAGDHKLIVMELARAQERGKEKEALPLVEALTRNASINLSHILEKGYAKATWEELERPCIDTAADYQRLLKITSLPPKLAEKIMTGSLELALVFNHLDQEESASGLLGRIQISPNFVASSSIAKAMAYYLTCMGHNDYHRADFFEEISFKSDSYHAAAGKWQKAQNCFTVKDPCRATLGRMTQRMLAIAANVCNGAPAEAEQRAMRQDVAYVQQYCGPVLNELGL